MQTYIVIVSGSILNVSTVHLNGILHLRMSLSIGTCIRRTPCIKRTLQHSPEGVRLIQVSLYMLSFFPILVGLQHKPLTRADTVGSLPKIEFKTKVYNYKHNW